MSLADYDREVRHTQEMSKAHDARFNLMRNYPELESIDSVDEQVRKIREIKKT